MVCQIMSSDTYIGSEFTKSVIVFLYNFIRPQSVNNVAVTVLYILREYHRRSMVYRVL